MSLHVSHAKFYHNSRTSRWSLVPYGGCCYDATHYKTQSSSVRSVDCLSFIGPGITLLYVTRKLSHPGSWQIINLYEFYIDPRNYFWKYPKPNTNLSILCDWNFGFQNRYWNIEPTCGGNGSDAAFGKHSHTVMLEHQTLRLQDDGKCFRKNLVQWARENSNVIQM